MSVTVRAATEADADAVREVGLQTWPATYGPIAGAAYVEQGLARWWSRDAVLDSIRRGGVFVAEQDGAVVGMASLGEHDGVPMLWKLYVVPSAQGAGVGAALLAAAIDSLPSSADRLRLDHTEGNEQAAAFYRRKGFREVGRYPGAIQGPDEILMELLLR